MSGQDGDDARILHHGQGEGGGFHPVALLLDQFDQARDLLLDGELAHGPAGRGHAVGVRTVVVQDLDIVGQHPLVAAHDEQVQLSGRLTSCRLALLLVVGDGRELVDVLLAEGVRRTFPARAGECGAQQQRDDKD